MLLLALETGRLVGSGPPRKSAISSGGPSWNDTRRPPGAADCVVGLKRSGFASGLDRRGAALY